MTVSVTANGALAPFTDRAGTAVAIYFAGQSIIVSVLGTTVVLLLDGDTAWPLIGFAAILPAIVILIGRWRGPDIGCQDAAA